MNSMKKPKQQEQDRTAQIGQSQAVREGQQNRAARTGHPGQDRK
jgi:hypothetical protein